MGLRRIKPHWMIGTVCGLVFVSLLAIRLGVFEKSEIRGGEKPSPDAMQANRETWMKVSQQGRRIGYVHRELFRTEEGYKTIETAFMKINTLGLTQEIRFRTAGDFRNDLTLTSFEFDLQSSLFRFKARGVVNEKTLTLHAGTPGSERTMTLPLDGKTYLPLGMTEVLVNEKMKPGESRVFHLFDPATLTRRPVKVTALPGETVSIMGHEEKARKFSVNLMGAPQLAWIGEDGTVLKEEGSLGFRLERVTREEALSKVSSDSGPDITQIASILSNRTLENAGELKELELSIDGIVSEDFFLDGGRQSLKERVLTIHKEPLPGRVFRRKGGQGFDRGRTYLESTPLIETDHPEIRSIVEEIVAPGDTDLQKARKLIKWVNEKIEKKPVLSVPSALETLRHRVGDCNEHAVLLAALARAAGIPAQVEAGLVYQRGRFYYHAWNALYLGEWITADAVTGQFPADVTHIRFVRGEERQIDLFGLIGRLRLEVLSAK
jgi:transglutaminase-like putative cysteine protease